MYKIISFLMILSCVSCYDASRDKIKFVDRFSVVDVSLKQATILYKKIEPDVDAIWFDSTGFYLGGFGYNNLNTLTDHSLVKLNRLNNKERVALANCLLVLSRNHIDVMSGSREGYVLFNYRAMKGAEWIDLRYIMVINSNVKLSDRDFKQYDKISDIRLLGNVPIKRN